MSYGYSSNGSSGLRLLPIVIGLIAAGFIMVKGCQEGPFGRTQVVGLSPQQEAALGAQSFQQVLSQERGHVIPPDAPISQTVKRIGLRLASAAEDPEVLGYLKLKPQKFNWEFRVIDSQEVNAFCLPGGKVVVYTGILPVCEDEAGLATVMGHEIGHALAHHGAERVAQQQLAQIGQVAVAGSMGDMPPEKRAAIMVALGAATQYGALLPFSRAHESEADHIGLILMAAAGYDPTAAAAFWQRMEKVGGSQRGEFTSTHPSHEHRIRDIQEWLPQARAFYQRSDKQNGSRPLPGIERKRY